MNDAADELAWLTWRMDVLRQLLTGTAADMADTIATRMATVAEGVCLWAKAGDVPTTPQMTLPLRVPRRRAG